jgi:hypothetical protein
LARRFNLAESLIGEENRIAITVWPDAASEQAYWNETRDNFKIGQKYATRPHLT